jgi:S1-C subfamily serine protease
MSIVKRTLITTVILALALGGLGIVAASASDRMPDQSAVYQEDEVAWLGVGVAETDEGVTVVEVIPGSPADDVGLRMGDVIVAVDDTEITSAEMLVDTIQSYKPGDEVVLTIVWLDNRREVNVTLAERPVELESPTPLVEAYPALGGVVNFLGLNAKLVDDGFLIDEIEPDSPLAESDLRVGDLITAINGVSVTGPGPRELMLHLRADRALTFTILRDGEEMEIEIEEPLIGDIEVVPTEPIESMMLPPTQLGVRSVTLTPDIAAEKDLPVEEGALIVEVFEGTPADDVGLQEDDIITAVDGDVVDQERTLRDRLYAYEEDDVVTLTVLRDEEELEIEVTLGPPTPGMIIFPDETWSGMFQTMPDFGPDTGWQQEFGPAYRLSVPFFCYPMYMFPFGSAQQGFRSGDESMTPFFYESEMFPSMQPDWWGMFEFGPTTDIEIWPVPEEMDEIDIQPEGPIA